jgi:hypothetical protein
MKGHVSVRQLVEDPVSVEGTSTFYIACRCGKQHCFTARNKDIIDWKKGQNVKTAFPNFTADQREIIISRLCPECLSSLGKPNT